MNLKMLILEWMVALLISPQVPGQVRALAVDHPQRTALMTWRVDHGKVRPEDLRYTPVALEQISPLLRRAVVLSEDGRFWRHGGLDLRAIHEAAWVNLGHRKIVRGASTITQQLCKNLFLTNRRTFDRKLREALLALYVEEVLDKRRILELYLNIIEWGPLVFGAEAAAQYHFGKPAAELTAEQAALLTAAIPFPLKAQPSAPSPYLYARTNQVLALMEDNGVIQPGSVAW
jgi:monofunctional glycosyltransferase